MTRLRTSPVFGPNYRAVSEPSIKVVVNQGGTSSTKTYSILQVLFTLAIQDPGCVITVAGQDIPNLKKGALRDALHISDSTPDIDDAITSYNKSDRIYYFKNGSIIEFASFSDEQDAKSGKRDYLFINEANGITYEVYWQLAIRTRKKVFIDYNPSAKFWVHEKLIGTPGAQLIISDHRHNPFLTQAQHDEIESIEDKELFKVYARGKTGNVRGLIYPKYQLCTGIPEVVDTVLGLDFGFNHKMALVEVGTLENRLYWHELIYQSELTISDLIALMKDLGISRRKKIFADSANPDKIEDLKRAGFNAFPADKDVKNGIDFVKRFQLFITQSSAGLRKEITHYKWKEAKDGRTLDEPVKLWDDACFVGETMVLTAAGDKRIDQIQVGEMVQTSQGLKKVLSVFDNGLREVRPYCFSFYGGEARVECTQNHKAKTLTGWAPISGLRIGDVIFTGGLPLPTLITEFSGGPKRTVRVYDICVEDAHEYFANGLLVHNCDAARYGTYSNRRPSGVVVATGGSGYDQRDPYEMLEDL